MLGEGEGVADSLTDGAGPGVSEVVALGVGSAVCGLLSGVSEGDGNVPVRTVNSAGESSTVVGVPGSVEVVVGELAVDGDAVGCAELDALGVGDDDSEGVAEDDGELDGVVDGLGDSTTVVATHSGGISDGMTHAVSSLAGTSSLVDSSPATGAWSTTAESAVASTASAAHAAGEPANTTTSETNTERPARTRVGIKRSLKVIGGCGSAV